jgi:hypothetical protein
MAIAESRPASSLGSERRRRPAKIVTESEAIALIRLAREKTPINVIRDALGHSTLALTDRYLRDVAPMHVIDVMRSKPGKRHMRACSDEAVLARIALRPPPFPATLERSPRRFARPGRGTP